MKTSSPPYLRPYPERVQIKEWLLIQDGVPTPFRELMPEWDPATNITVNMSAEVETQRILNDCQLSPDARLRLIAFWESKGTGLRDRGTFVDLDTNLPKQSAVLEVQIEGALVAGEVSVGISLLLSNPGKSVGRFSPKLTGCLLWCGAKNIVLEGTGTRFPIEMVDFGKSFSWLPENAGWFLDWDRLDFTRPVLGSVRLYINANHKRLKTAVVGTQITDQTIRETISFDVARTLIMTALDGEDFLANADGYADETVGAAIRRLIHALFAGNTLVALAQYQKQYPERFECQLQDRLKLFWKE